LLGDIIAGECGDTAPMAVSSPSILKICRGAQNLIAGRIKAARLAKVNEFVRDAIHDGCIARSITHTGLGDVRSGIQRMI